MYATIKCVMNTKQYSPVSLYSDPIQVKPAQNVDSSGVSSTRQSATRRPTTIRVPSKANSGKALFFLSLSFWPHLFCSVMLKSDLFSVSDNFEDTPPPLPVQKPVGDLKRQSLTPVPAPQVRFFCFFFNHTEPSHSYTNLKT